MKKYLIAFLLLSATISQAQVKILFDATKAESSGNGDWVIDADSHNLGFNNGPAVVGQGDESNPQRYPTPAQSTITSSTPETFWNGALSSWGIDMVKKGYEVETLPYNGTISYGNTGNQQDLSHYKVFVVDEPNIQFTSAEKTAILQFVQNGGGLFMISDHDQSDRNNDGWDSPGIWNDLMTTNSVLVNPFGISFDLNSYSGTYSGIANLSTDSILHGAMGNVTEVMWSAGTTMTLTPAANSSVKGLIYRSGSSGNSNVLCARARYGNGKVFAMGDSSPADDGTGDSNDQLYNGWITDANGNHERLIVNATIWLASGSSSVSIDTPKEAEKIKVYPNPASGNLFIETPDIKTNTVCTLFSVEGQLLESLEISQQVTQISIADFPKGLYFIRLTNTDNTFVMRFIKE